MAQSTSIASVPVRLITLPNGVLAAYHPEGCYSTSDAEPCNTFWGSHGCSLVRGHSGQHLCGATDPDGLCCTDTHWLNEDGSQGAAHSMTSYTRG